MCDTAGQPSKRFHLLGLAQLKLEVPRLSYVVKAPHAADYRIADTLRLRCTFKNAPSLKCSVSKLVAVRSAYNS